MMVDAIVRTLGRLYVSHRHLLQWVSAAHTRSARGLGVGSSYRIMGRGVLVALVGGAVTVAAAPSAWPLVLAIVVLWSSAPLMVSRISSPPRLRDKQLTDAERDEFRLIARRTWRFFESFVASDDNALPPDNFQESPTGVVAHRTSPTNIGLYFLAATVAYDFGWIGIVDLADRLERTMAAVDRLQKHRGHLYNWYDTQDLRPLDPMYVSMVDSGNLAGHLLALAQACRDAIREPVTSSRVLEGVRDAAMLALAAATDTSVPSRAASVRVNDLRDAAAVLLQWAEAATPTDESGWEARLSELEWAANQVVDIAAAMDAESSSSAGAEALVWATAAHLCIASHRHDMAAGAARVPAAGDPKPAPGSGRSEIEHRLNAVALHAEGLMQAMDFRFLMDESRKQFSIGYRASDATLDPSCYDLLASEARLGSFVAIAKDDVPPQHWFALSRTLTRVGRGAALMSWSGSMFEYLMPLLVMNQPAEGLLDSTCRRVVERQIAYGAERGVPWGVSESAHNIRDVELTYQYSDFGVPGLGLRRGLGADVVVAPYATALAAMLRPGAALKNFRVLEEAGALGPFGYYEALDYTPTSIPNDERVAVVKTYMAHHQGMSLIALGNVVHDGRTQRRFHDHPLVRATDLLLQERTPRMVPLAAPRSEDADETPHVRDFVLPTRRVFESPHDITPRTHLLSNGHYTVMMTAAGSGFSRRGDLAVTRWREDSTRDCWGNFAFLRDVATGRVWSAGFQPAGTDVDHYEAVYLEDRARIEQRDESLAIALDVIVSPQDDAELRQLTITNLEDRDREIDITSYAEVVLATQAADEAHPAFSNLFVQTEWVPESEVLLAMRRPRSSDESAVWLAHLLTVEQSTGYPVQYETDRARFLGRGRGIRSPQSVIDGGALSNTVGTVLDPIVSLRQRVSLPQGRTVRLVMTTLVADTRDKALEVAEKYRQQAAFEREASLAWTHAQVQLHHLRISQDEAHLFQRLANRLIYVDRSSRAAPGILAANMLGQPDLWRHGISGDLPIALVHLEREEDRDVVRQALRAHEYWRLKGLGVDLVIINSTATSYASGVHEMLEDMLHGSRLVGGGEARGDVYLLRDDHLSEQDRGLLRAAARIEIQASAGTLAEHVVRSQSRRPGPVPVGKRPVRPKTEVVAPQRLPLEMFNGLGGFDRDGSEYVVTLGAGQWTPSPWINVIANPDFGFQVSASGSGFTWSSNSRENKLTPWSNDAVSDTPGEVFYVRDEESGLLWGPTVLPIREDESPYVCRHGQGYSRFTHTAHGIALDLVQFVAPKDSVKLSRLRVENLGKRTRTLSVTGYVEWVLGVAREASAPHIITELDGETNAILARNAWNGEFAGRVAFADLGGRQTSWTADRLEFLGRNASLDHPASQEGGVRLSGRTGAGFDPCAALSTTVTLAPGESTDILFLLGEAPDASSARTLIDRYRTADTADLLRDVRARWDDVLGAIEV
ncbi:MAG: cyclic beta-1,2-glucan synthetase, partial [Glaciecola sp.]